MLTQKYAHTPTVHKLTNTHTHLGTQIHINTHTQATHLLFSCGEVSTLFRQHLFHIGKEALPD